MLKSIWRHIAGGPDKLAKELESLLKLANPNKKTYYEIAWRYEIGLGVKKNPTEAKRWYKKAFKDGKKYFESLAKKGDKKAQFVLGRIYANGQLLNGECDDSKIDNELAEYWLKLSANQNYRPAQNSLGILYEEDNNDYSAVFWYRMAAHEGGFAPAQYNIARMHCDKKGGCEDEFDYTCTRSWLIKAAEQGYGPAQYWLYTTYKKWAGSTHNVNASNEYAQLAHKYRDFASFQGITDETVAQEEKEEKAKQAAEEEAEEEAEEAAERKEAAKAKKEQEEIQNQVEAQEQEFEDLLSSAKQMRKIEKDAQKAEEPFIQEGREQRYYKLSHHYRNGIGTFVDLVQAEIWRQRAFEYGGLIRMRQAAEEGDNTSQFCLGMGYLKGEGGVTPDKEKAFKWFSKAAKNNYAPAQYYLSKCYGLGEGTVENHDKEFKWLLKAAEKNYPYAHYELGIYYENDSNNEKANKRFILVAAEFGCVEAQFVLGKSYALGNGIEKNNSLAGHWFQKAVDQGYAPAEKKQWYHDERFTTREEGFSSKEKQQWDKKMLFHAASKGDTSYIEKIFDGLNRSYAANISSMDTENNTVLHYAAIHDHADTVRYLLNKGANVNAINNSNETSLIAIMSHYPTYSSFLETIKVLYLRTDLDLQDSHGRSAIAWTVIIKRPDVLKLLLKASNNLEAELSRKLKNEKNYTLFLIAAENGCEKSIQLLFEHGSNVLVCSDKKENALMVCAYNNRNTVWKKLIEIGAPVIGRNSQGKTALQIAIQYDHLPLIIALVAARILFLIANKQLSCPKNNVLKDLFKHIGSLTLRDDHFRTLLHVAANSTNAIFTDYLLEKGADDLVNTVDDEENNAEEIAEGLGYGIYKYDFSDIVNQKKLLQDKSPILNSLLKLYTSLNIKSLRDPLIFENSVNSSNYNQSNEDESSSDIEMVKERSLNELPLDQQATRFVREDINSERLKEGFRQSLISNDLFSQNLNKNNEEQGSKKNEGIHKIKDSKPLKENSTKKILKATRSAKAKTSPAVLPKPKVIPFKKSQQKKDATEPLSKSPRSVKANASSDFFRTTPRRSPRIKNQIKVNDSLSTSGTKRKRAEEPSTSPKRKK